jgi:hypothetical protein
MSYARRAEQADRDRLLGQDTPAPWRCPTHPACTCPPPAPAATCSTHGTYQPANLLDADCPECEDRIARLDAQRDWYWANTRHPRDRT